MITLILTPSLYLHDNVGDDWRARRVGEQELFSVVYSAGKGAIKGLRAIITVHYALLCNGTRGST